VLSVWSFGVAPQRKEYPMKAQLAYAIWPWGLSKRDQLVTAIRDIKEAGFHYFESVQKTVELFKNDGQAFKDIVEEYRVYPVSFYFHMRGDPKQDLETLRASLDFLAANKIRTISVQAAGKPGGGATEEELRYALATINEFSRLGRPYGITPCLHPHANTTVMFATEIDFIMRNTDPALVAFGPDTAHLAVGKCDPVEIFDRYAARIRFVHLKDVRKGKPVNGDGAQKEGFEIYSSFLELGAGTVDFPAIFKVLESVKYDGFLTLELDSSRFSNKQSALMNMDYMKKHGF
jgi:inosose dehydratase